MGPLRKGFTLLETVAAILIISLSFGFLLFVLTDAVRNLAKTKTLWGEFKRLDYLYKSGNFTNLSTREVRIEKYGVTLRVISYGNLTFYEVVSK